MKVDEARDGEEGLRSALGVRYDAVILDLQLPKIDGMTVLRQLLAARAGHPVVVSSCASDALIRNECVRAGATFFLAKPFSIIELVGSVGTACAATGAIPSLRRTTEYDSAQGDREGVLRSPGPHVTAP
jgi:DNA-binding response OmpR family regulator